MTLERPPSTAPGDDGSWSGPPQTARRRIRFGTTTGGLLAGVAAGALSLGIAEVVAGLVAPASAPLVALGDVVVGRVPPWLKNFAVANFGTHDKQVLLGSALLIALVLSAVSGVLAVQGRRGAVFVVLGLGALAALAAATRPNAGTLAVLPSVAGAAAGMIVLTRLATTVRQSVTAEPGTRSDEVAGRRAFLALGAALAGGVVFGGLGRVLGARLRGTESSRAAIRFPAAADPAPALPSGVEVGVAGVAPFLTPNADFYRIDTALVVPLLRAENWSLRIHGLVDREVTLTYADLLRGPLVERDLTLMCVSNYVGGDLTSNARWLGRPLAQFLKQAGPSKDADMVLSTSSDGWTAGTPLEVLLDGRDALLAVGMNGEPLPVEHGFPVRMVVPGLYGYVSATKWVVDLEVTRFDRAEGYWTPRGWSARGPVKTGSRFDVPKDRDHVKAGSVALAGIAWQEHVGIEGVQIRVDDGPWQAAELGAEDGIDTWRQWVYRWNATAGKHRLQVRAVNAQGAAQTGAEAEPAPDGATGWHTIEVTVQ